MPILSPVVDRRVEGRGLENPAAAVALPLIPPRLPALIPKPPEA